MKESQRGISQDLIGSQPDDLPSNQEMLNNDPSQTTTDLQEEFDSLSLLTQYLGPSGSSTRRRHRIDPENAVEKQKNDFKYLEFTELLDRATSYLESLSNAKSKGRTPTRLRITTKLVVVCSEDEDFKIKWAQACKQVYCCLCYLQYTIW